MLERLYGARADYPRFVAALDAALARAWAERPADLKRLDLRRDLEPDWFQRPGMAGYVFYLDRFNGDLAGVLDKLDWLERLGVSYVHFMPCLKPRPGDSDGGYSVIDYRAINPAYGTMAEFEAVARALRERGISLCVDFVLNHTAKEHAWAKKAAKGVAKYRDYYLMFDDDTLPKAVRGDADRGVPRQRPGQLHLLPRVRQVGLDHVQRAPVGPELGQPLGVPRDGRGDAVPRQQGRGRGAARRGRVHVEAHGHALPVRARGAHDPARAARGEPDRRAERDPSRGGDRRARRDGALPRRRRAFRQGGQPRLPQLADGAVLGRARHARDPADDLRARHALPARCCPTPPTPPTSAATTTSAGR